MEGVPGIWLKKYHYWRNWVFKKCQ